MASTRSHRPLLGWAAAGLLSLAACPREPKPEFQRVVNPPLRDASAAETSSTTRPPPDPAAVARSEGRVRSAPGIEVFFTRVRPAAGPVRGAVVFTHGAGSPASAVWDLPRGYSVMAALARLGFDCFTVDVRGFGGSSRPPVLDAPAEDGPPAVRAADAIPDVDAVVDEARRAAGRARVDLVGWSWGSLLAGLYAGEHPEKVRRLVLFAPVFDRKWPGRHRTEGAWREETRALHMKWLDPEKEDPEIRRAYVDRLFRFTEGDVLRLPNGPYRDVYGPDAPIWAPEAVRAETLVVRGTDDRASLRPHALQLFDRLVEARTRAYLELGGAGHFAFRTRAGAPALRGAIVGFVAGEEGLTPAGGPASTPAGASAADREGR